MMSEFQERQVTFTITPKNEFKVVSPRTDMPTSLDMLRITDEESLRETASHGYPDSPSGDEWVQNDTSMFSISEILWRETERAHGRLRDWNSKVTYGVSPTTASVVII